MKRLLGWLPEEPMKWIIYILILLSIAGVLKGSWIAFPLSKGWSALKFSLFGYQRANPYKGVASFGVLAALALLAGAEGYRRKRWMLTYCSGAALLLVAFAGLLDLAFGQPALLKDSLNEATWQQAAIVFAQGYLPSNPVTEPSVLTSLMFNSIGWRIYSGWYMMGMGWYVAVAMALALMICGGRGLTPRPARRAFGATFALLAGLAIVFLLRPLIGERDINAAVRSEALSHPAEAKTWYEKAMRDDGWNALDLGVYQRIGAVDRALGRLDTPEYHIYWSEQMVLEQKLPEAIAQYEAIAAGDGTLGAVARDRASELWVMYGLNLFTAGAYGAAVAALEHALDYQPTMWIAAFYLTRAYFAVGDYGKVAALAARCAEFTNDPQFLSNIYSNSGDAEYRLGDFGDGHVDYSESYYYDYVPNWRSLTSLAGSVGN
jgi:hypothetical protein